MFEVLAIPILRGPRNGRCMTLSKFLLSISSYNNNIFQTDSFFVCERLMCERYFAKSLIPVVASTVTFAI